MFKKFLACLLTLALVLSFAACGAPSNVRGEISNNGEKPTEAPTEPQFDIGTSVGNTYKNEFIGIQCSLDENWTFMTDAEIRAQNEATMGLVGDQYKDALSSAAVVYDMMATNANLTDTVGVVLEKLGGINLLISEEQYITASKDGALGSLESMGIVIDSAEVITIQFAGAEHYGLAIEGSYAGIPIYECMVVVKCNGYIACITACTWNENTCTDILNQFKAC